VGWLEKVGMLRRTRTPGKRADRVMIHPSYGVQALESQGRTRRSPPSPATGSR
jgi:hypothetical protein